jgi:Xaa-Pro aminopeptidase
VNGRFSGPQKDIYELVLAAQYASRRRQAGCRFPRLFAAERVLAQGYIDLGLCRGTLDEVLENESFSSSACIARDTGSAWTCMTRASTKVKGASQKLVPGMALTVEPGAHSPCGQRAGTVLEHRRAHRGRRTGRRRVTKLTAATPKTVAEVEAACVR